MTDSGLTAQDRFALADLVARYAHAVDGRDLQGVVKCFAPDGRLEFASSGIVLDGRAAIEEFFGKAFSGSMLGGSAASTHLMGNTMVTRVEPAGTSIVTSAVAYLATSGVVEHAGTVTGRVVVRGLTYTDRCGRIDGRWFLLDRVHRLHWQGEMPGGPASVDPLRPR